MAKKLETIVNKEDIKKDGKKNISLTRIALTTIGYGVAGCVFNNPEVVAPATAAIGLGLSIYDEVKQRGMDLTWPAAGFFAGGLIGTIFDTDSIRYLPHIFSYGGAVVGGILGTYKTYLSMDKPKE
jgi:hypothetical protein